MHDTSAPGKSHIRGNGIFFVFMGVVFCISAILLMVGGRLADGLLLLVFDGIFLLGIGILGIIYCNKPEKARLLRVLVIIYLVLYSMGVLIILLSGGIRVMHFIMLSAIVWFLIGTHRNIKEFDYLAVSTPEAERYSDLMECKALVLKLQTLCDKNEESVQMLRELGTVTDKDIRDGLLVCPLCVTRQEQSHMSCFQCGIAFVRN